MSESSTAKDRKLALAEWGWRMVCFVLLCANLYLKGNFVTLEAYQKDKESNLAVIANITRILTTQEERNKVNDRQDEQLKDHETRLRVLESKHP